MNGRMITAALALAGIAGAQSVEDTVARAQAKTASQRATAAKIAADSALAADAEQDNKIQAVDSKIDGLNEDYLATKSTVTGLAKLKVSGYIQFQYALNADTNLASAPGYSQKQGAWSLRRGRVKLAYNAGNGAEFAWEPNFLESKFSINTATIKYTEQWLKSFWVLGGIQDIPFGYEIGYSSSGMEWLERSRFEQKSVFNGEKTLGAVLGFTSNDIPVNFKFGWLNGQTQQSVITDWSATQDPKNFVGRLGFTTAFNDLGLSVDGGASYYYDSKLLTDTTNGGSIREMRNDSLVTVNHRFRQDLNTGVYGADLQATYEIPGLGGLKLLGEYYGGKVVGNNGNLLIYTGAAPGTVLTTGGSAYNAIPDIRNVQAFYAAAVLNPVAFLPQLQLLYRFDYFDPNSDVSGNQIQGEKVALGAADVAYTTQSLGLNWFVNGNFKVCLAYDIVSNETTNAPSMDGWSSDKARTVVQGALKTGTYTAKNDFSKDIDDNVLTLRGQVSF